MLCREIRRVVGVVSVRMNHQRALASPAHPRPRMTRRTVAPRDGATLLPLPSILGRDLFLVDNRLIRP